MNVWLVLAEHHVVPVLQSEIYHTEDAANERAVELVNLIREDIDIFEKPEPATVETWETVIAWAQSIHGAAHCYVEVMERPVLGNGNARQICPEAFEALDNLLDEAENTQAFEDALIGEDEAMLKACNAARQLLGYEQLSPESDEDDEDE